MRRYYINRRIGSGTRADPYTSELRAFVWATFTAKPLQQIIAHTCPWVLMKYDLTTAQHDAVMATVPQVFSFPEGALDRAMSSIPASLRNAIANRLDTIGFDSAWVTGATTVRAVLEYLAHTIQLSEWLDIPITAQNFDVRKTVADIPVAKRAAISERLQQLGLNTAGITVVTPLSEVIRRVQFQDDGTTPRLVGVRRRRPMLFHDEEAE